MRGGIERLWRDPRVRHDLSLCHLRGMCLYQLRPDLLPQGCMTDIERGLWVLFFDDLQAKREAAKH
ncbi:MAG TPA: hypothetical protein ENI92_01875 [Bacteroidetes bacterium]|nr:hypothetical protein [Bacteroidota bacterium]